MATEGNSRRVALVLGAGGARGLAHIGAIQAIEARGLEVVAIAGSSMGAVVGGIHAAGRLDEYRRWVAAMQRSDVLRLLDFAFGHPGLIKGEKLIGALAELVGDHVIEDLPIQFTAVATDLGSQREVWITQGKLFDAIRASIAIPMVFTPHRIDGRELVDGGLLAPVPIAATRLSRVDLVIAIDVNARPAPARLVAARNDDKDPEPVIADTGGDGDPDDESYREKIAALIQGLLPKRTPAAPQRGLVDLLGRSLDTMQGQIARLQLALDPPDLLIRVPRDVAFFYEFWRGDELVPRGREIAEQALDEAGL